MILKVKCNNSVGKAIHMMLVAMQEAGHTFFVEVVLDDQLQPSRARTAYKVTVPDDQVPAILAQLGEQTMTGMIFRHIATSTDVVTERTLRELLPFAKVGSVQGRLQDLRGQGLVKSESIT